MIACARLSALVLSVAVVATAIASCVRNTPGTAADAAADAPSGDSGEKARSDGTRPDAGLTGATAADAGTPQATAERGKMLYGRYCNFCHGDAGRGYAADEAPALANDDLLTIASDDYLRTAILRGRPGTTMSAWGVARGGPVSDVDAAAIVLYLRTWQTRPSVVAAHVAAEPDAGADARVFLAPKGDVAHGAAIYGKSCASCHGREGHGGKYNALANAELLASASDAFLATTIARGRAGTPMVGFADKLEPHDIDDLVALLRSWQKPPEEALDLPPKPGALTNVVVNPKGPQPAFDAKADFIPVDTVKRELARHATMIFVDARAPGDYARMHVAGAISVPFYQVDAYAPQIPRDRFILTYCACPHAASVKARDALRAAGYARAAVLDEGILVWRDRGYPVRGGAKP